MLTGQQEFKVATRFDFIYLYDAKPLLWYFDLPGEVTWASVVVWGISGFTVWGDGILGSGVVVLTGGLVVRGAGLATVLVITMGTLVVRTGGLGVVRIWGLGVVLAGAGGWGGGVVAGTCGCTGAVVVGTAGEVQKQKRMSKSKKYELMKIFYSILCYSTFALWWITYQVHMSSYPWPASCCLDRRRYIWGDISQLEELPDTYTDMRIPGTSLYLQWKRGWYLNLVWLF